MSQKTQQLEELQVLRDAYLENEEKFLVSFLDSFDREANESFAEHEVPEFEAEFEISFE